MKFLFEPNLDFQLQAIEAVCDLFRGQELDRTEFTVEARQMPLDLDEGESGYGNRLQLPVDAILANLREIQLRNGIRQSDRLESRDFTVEMETGTGKTYVYLRTIFELHRRFGFTKFAIVVPSIAIKEGVYKSLRIMEDHFRSLYANAPFDYFLYDSGKLGQVRGFAANSHIQIMVVTVGAINKKDVNSLYKDNEKTGGEAPIELIKQTRPVLIVDEPQSVDGGLEGRGKEALEAMQPLCTLRYSATHATKYHMVYSLNAVDAYEKKLVKRIEVASATVEDAFNKPYVRLIRTSNKSGTISATIEVDVQNLAGVHRQEIAVLHGEYLEQATGRPVYAGCRVGEIRTGKGKQSMELQVPGGEVFLQQGQEWGSIDPLAVQRQMIQRTIKEHLDKEMRLRPLGIKVLSLFFVDAVAKYRQYGDDGQPLQGEYARIFEEEYRRLAKHPDYNTLFKEVDLSRSAEAVHGGYFSVDRKKVGGKVIEKFKDTRGEGQADNDTYQLIMRDKERLLSLDTPLKFIFSHSALREGWDNPNVFQICALRDIQTERERRQTVGRGLRLCVNGLGERLRDPDVNILTVIAKERYEQFAENLQREIEEETGIRFGIVEEHQFAGLSIADASGNLAPLGFDGSKLLWTYLRDQGLINAKGKVQDALRQRLADGTLALPQPYAAMLGPVREELRKLCGRLEVRNADERRKLTVNKKVLLGPDFMALWDRIKHKTTYRVQFDNEQLLESCTQALRKAPAVPKSRLQWRKADIAIGKGGVEATEREGAATVLIAENDIQLPDILTALQDRTQLTRRSIVRILLGSHRIGDFRRNPQAFIELAGDAINACKRLAIVDGIKYQRLGDEHYFAQELFQQQELTGYLKRLVEAGSKSIFDQVSCGSDDETKFAKALRNNNAVKVFAKLPSWFKVPTPLGTYNPDWAVLVEQDGLERLYLVVETKSSLIAEDLRDKERAKIECGKAHFQALATGENPAQFKLASTLENLLASLATNS